MTTNTIHCTVLAKDTDIMNYSTMVFENLDNNSFGQRYLMTVIFPNWESYIPQIGESGFLTYTSVLEGVDTWYDKNRNIQVPYNYSNLIFIKFVKQVDPSKKDIII